MEIRRGNPVQKKQKKPRERKNKVSRRVDFENLPPAIVDGKLVVNQDDVLILHRAWRGPNTPLSYAHVLSVSESGYVNLYDDTLGQAFPFQLGSQTAEQLTPYLRVYRRAPRPEQPVTADIASSAHAVVTGSK